MQVIEDFLLLKAIKTSDSRIMIIKNYFITKLKRVFQENKARQIFRKTSISYPLVRTRTCEYQGVRNVRFSENLTLF